MEMANYPGQARAIENQIKNLPNAARYLENQTASLERVIRKNPKFDPRVMHSLRELEKDRRDIGVAAGKLDPERAANREGLVMRWLGEEPTGHEIYMGHRLGIEQAAPEGLVPRSPGVGQPKLPRGWSQKNESVLLNNGMINQDVHGAINDWQAAHSLPRHPPLPRRGGQDG